MTLCPRKLGLESLQCGVLYIHFVMSVQWKHYKVHPLFRVSFIESFSNINTVCSPNHIELFTPLPLNYKKEYLVCVGSYVCLWVCVGVCVCVGVWVWVWVL